MTPADLSILREIVRQEPPDIHRLRAEVEKISGQNGPQAAHNAVMRLETALRLRKPTLGFFDHTGHIIGGGQKYGFTLVGALQDMFDITLILNRPVTLDNIRDWYRLDLSACAIKIIDIPFFKASESPHLDPARISRRMENPFHIISRESGHYDFFINNSMNEMVYPLANVSALICHFPERRPRSYFYADKYTYVIHNSLYTAGWIEKKWKFRPHFHLYPPVDMAPEDSGELSQKEKIILSVARFESGGSKKQVEMAQTFIKLTQRFPEAAEGWRLALAGGSADSNAYLQKLKTLMEQFPAAPISLCVNISGDEMTRLYRKASIFWHVCGLDQTDPAQVEHFGMTIGEAMQNRIPPVVFDGGGQREIVEHGVQGFRVASTAQLMNATLQLMRDENLRLSMGRHAEEKSRLFHRKTFEKRTVDFFSKELEAYRAI